LSKLMRIRNYLKDTADEVLNSR